MGKSILENNKESFQNVHLLDRRWNCRTVRQWKHERGADTFDVFTTLNAIPATCLMPFFVKFVFDQDSHAPSNNVLSSILCLRLMISRWTFSLATIISLL